MIGGEVDDPLIVVDRRNGERRSAAEAPGFPPLPRIVKVCHRIAPVWISTATMLPRKVQQA
jgi:hypothetical protein